MTESVFSFRIRSHLSKLCNSVCIFSHGVSFIKRGWMELQASVEGKALGTTTNPYHMQKKEFAGEHLRK